MTTWSKKSIDSYVENKSCFIQQNVKNQSRFSGKIKLSNYQCKDQFQGLLQSKFILLLKIKKTSNWELDGSNQASTLAAKRFCKLIFFAFSFSDELWWPEKKQWISNQPNCQNFQAFGLYFGIKYQTRCFKKIAYRDETMNFALFSFSAYEKYHARNKTIFSPVKKRITEKVFDGFSDEGYQACVYRKVKVRKSRYFIFHSTLWHLLTIKNVMQQTRTVFFSQIVNHKKKTPDGDLDGGNEVTGKMSMTYETQRYCSEVLDFWDYPDPGAW